VQCLRINGDVISGVCDAVWRGVYSFVASTLCYGVGHTVQWGDPTAAPVTWHKPHSTEQLVFEELP
jgi:hypothetical protein